jgi:hypothetical protein
LHTVKRARFEARKMCEFQSHAIAYKPYPLYNHLYVPEHNTYSKGESACSPHTADGNYRLVNSNSGLCVEVPGFSKSNGTQLDTWGAMQGPIRSGC